MVAQWWKDRVSRKDRIAVVFVIEMCAMAWVLLLGIVPIVAIIVTGIAQGTIPEGADDGYVAHGPGYPAFSSLSAGLIVPALAMLATWFMTLDKPLKEHDGPRRLDLGLFSLVGAGVAVTAAALDVQEPSWVALLGVIASGVFLLTAVVFMVRSVLGWVRLVPRSWREESSSKRRRR